jgi:hypothetical protein
MDATGIGAVQESPMFSESLSHPEKVYVEFSLRHVSQDAVMRASVSHGQWIVPWVYWIHHYDRQAVQRAQDEVVEIRAEYNTIVFSTHADLPSTELWLFTSYEAAMRAKQQGVQLGPCFDGVRGTVLYGNLNPEWEWVRANPGSPAELTMSLPRAGGFPDAKRWAEAIAFEESIAQVRSTEPSVIAQGLRRYNNFIILIMANGRSLTLINHLGVANAIAAFTAPDCQAAFLEQLTPEQRAGIQPMDTTGSILVDTSREWGMDGIIVNPSGPGPTVFCPFE